MSSQKQVVTELCKLLNEGDDADRCYASRALGVARDPAAVSDLIARLSDDDIDVCVDAATALGEIGAPEAVPNLIRSLQGDQSGEVCSAVASALGRIGGEDATEALLRVAIERPAGIEWDEDWDPWWDVQLEAVKALGRFRNQRAVQPLIDILENESQQDIESEILLSLAQIGGAGIDFLIARLEERQSMPHFRRRTAVALGRAAPDATEAAQALGRALQDPAPEVRAEAVKALAERGEQRYLRALRLLLRDPDGQVRSTAFNGVVKLVSSADEGADFEELAQMLDDPSSTVRRALFEALGQQTPGKLLQGEQLQKVYESLKDDDAECAAAACRLLVQHRDATTLEALLQVMDDAAGHPMVRREAALAVGRIGVADARVIDALERAVCDPQQPLRLAALGTLVALSGHATEPGDGQENADPLQIVIDALRGEIGPGIQREPVAAGSPPESATAERVPQADVVQDAQPSTAAPLDLPAQGAEIVQTGEVEQALSTLEAIAMENVAASLYTAPEEAPPQYDAETLEYLEIVEQNKSTMARIRSRRKLDPAQDTRCLAARVLAGSDSDAGIAALLEALNDDDAKLRCEAADAIGRIALGDAPPAALMDALGSLITQLTVGDLDQRLSCARTLGRLGNQAAAIPLMEALKDQSANVRIQAIEALATLAGRRGSVDDSDHMVVRNVPPLSIARKIVAALDDQEMGVRVAAARSMPALLAEIESDSFHAQALDKLIGSVMQWSGEEARLIGRALRGLERERVVAGLLQQLQQCSSSLQRSVVIEMLEELLAPEAELPEAAA
jgi:HEAT repeat protein